MTAMFGWIAIGLIVGLVGKLIFPGRDPGGLVVPSLMGMAGAILAGLAGQVAGLDLYNQAAGYAVAAVGAVALVVLYRIVVTIRG